MLYLPTYGGSPIFGTAVRIRHNPNPSAQQIDAFFGQTGQLGLFGGGRGRMFLIQGVFVEETVADIGADLGNIMSYQDGIARSLSDTMGRTWSNVIFEGQLQEDPAGPVAGAGGVWVMSYKMSMRGLS